MKLDGGAIFEDSFRGLVGLFLKHGKLDANYYFRKENGQSTASFIFFLGLSFPVDPVWRYRSVGTTRLQ